ncbi:MAG: DUF2971 domain-containing protein [Gammaproteobacteria bacterium]|nr:DUF2971 domain-containing protein [Gammaproteobacteria bacterium]
MADYRFFKYKPVSKNLLKSLVDSSIFCASPAKLNDPFDCQVDLAKSLRLAASRVEGSRREALLRIADSDEFVNGLKKKMEPIGVCSFSQNLEHPLMWSHYADEHRGLCLLYEFEENFLRDASNEIIGVSDMVCDDDALSKWLVEIIPNEIDEEFYDYFTKELLKKVLIVKASAWDYEQEIRIIREHEGVFPIPKECLKQICFGLRTPESDINLVRRIVDSSGYSVEYCKISNSTTDFGINASEI